MKISIVVDANIIISALLGGKPRFILFDRRFAFITNEFTLQEVKNYIPLISRKSDVNQTEIEKEILLLPLKVVSRNYYHKYLKQAADLIGKIDQNDIEILSLYLKEGTFLWSEDKDFEQVEYRINLLKTKDWF